MEWTIRIIGALAALIVVGVLFVIFKQLRNPRPEPRHLPEGERFLNPMVALELAETPEEVTGIAGSPGSENRETMRKGIKGDFVFIAAYWLFFIALSALLVQR